jgi:glycosyltransferase involved in cell wall biosynthesis
VADVVASVLVPLRNERRRLPATIAGLRALRLDGPVEFLLVDGRSQDGTATLLTQAARDDERIRVLDNPHGSVPAALNVALRHARGEYVARIDAHADYPPDYVAAGIERLRRGDVAWVSGPQLPHGDGRWSRRVALALGSWLGIGGATFRRAHEVEVEVESGFCGIWRRETLEALGGWDESFAVNEDADLAARTRERGERIVCLPELAARYEPRDSLGALARQYWRYGHYRVKTVRRHPRSLRRSHVLAPVLALIAGAARFGVRPARRALQAYAIVLAVAAARCDAPARDAAAVPGVLAVMHLSWGLGFLAGCLRFGPPLSAIRSLAR